MLKFLIFAAVLYLVYRIFIKSAVTRSRTSYHKAGSGEVDDMVQDPVCKTYVHLRDAQKRIIGGKQYFFCSDECARKYEESLQQKDKDHEGF